MKFTTLSTAPFINLMVALLLHNSSSSIVAAKEDVVSFSTTTTDNNAVESVIDLNQSRSLGKGSDKKVLSEVLLEKEKEYLDQKVKAWCPSSITLANGISVNITNVTSFVEVVLTGQRFVNEIPSEGYYGFLKFRGTVGALSISKYDWSLPNTTSIKEDKCEGYEFGVEGEFTKDICAARKKVVAICDKEPTCNEETFNDETFDDSFRLRAAKFLEDKTVGGKVLCSNTDENKEKPEQARRICGGYKYDENGTDPITTQVTQFFYLMNACLPEGFNNPLLGSGPLNIAIESYLLDGKPVYLIQDGWLSLYKQVTDEINKTSYMDLLIKSTVMRFFAIHWINEKYGISEFKFDDQTRVSNGRQFENVAMESYFMEKYSKDFLTRKEKKDLFKFTDFNLGEYLVCASHLGAKLAHEECNATAAYEKIQEISISKIRPENVTNNVLICGDKYFDENLRNNWRKYAKKVMDKTMTSKCDKKTGKKSSKSEKKASKKLR